MLGTAGMRLEDNTAFLPTCGNNGSQIVDQRGDFQLTIDRPYQLIVPA
jgi:hypothetical protein